MRSYSEIMDRLSAVNKLLQTDNGSSLELITMEAQALEWVLKGSRRYSFKTIKELVEKYMSENGISIKGPELIYYIANKLKETDKLKEER